MVFLVLLVAGGAFAQMPDGLKLGVEVGTGLLVTTPDGDYAGKTTTAEAKTYDKGGSAYHIRLNLDYTKENFGFRTRFQARSTSGPFTNQNVRVENYEAWFTALDGKLKIGAGNRDWDHHIRTPGHLGDANFSFGYGPHYDSGNGNILNVSYKLFDGLTVWTNSGGGNNPDLVYIFGNTAFGAVYSKNGITGNVSFKETVTAGTDPSLDTYSGALKFGFAYAADAFTVALDGKVNDLGLEAAVSDSKGNKISPVDTQIWLTGKYDLNKLSVFMSFGLGIFGSTDEKVGSTTPGEKTTSLPVVIIPGVKYTLNDTMALELATRFAIRNYEKEPVYGTPNTTNLTNSHLDDNLLIGGKSVLGRAWGDSTGSATTNKLGEKANFSVGLLPSFSWQLGSTAKIVLYDEILIAGTYFTNGLGVFFDWTY